MKSDEDEKIELWLAKPPEDPEERRKWSEELFNKVIAPYQEKLKAKEKSESKDNKPKPKA